MQEIRQIQGVGGHIFAALRRALGRVILTFLGFGVGGAAIVEGTSYLSTRQVFSTLPNVAAIVFGVVLAYAAALTVIVAEAIRALTEAIRDIVNDAGNVEKSALGAVEKAAGGAEGAAGNLVKTVEGGLQSRFEQHDAPKA